MAHIYFTPASAAKIGTGYQVIVKTETNAEILPQVNFFPKIVSKAYSGFANKQENKQIKVLEVQAQPKDNLKCYCCTNVLIKWV